MFAKTDQLVRHFIDTFGPIIKHIRPILLQVKPALSFAENCETLRNSYFFNPIYEGAKMGMPATGTVCCQIQFDIALFCLICNNYVPLYCG